MASDNNTFKSSCIYCCKPFSEDSPLENPIGLNDGSHVNNLFLKLISRHLKLKNKNTTCLEQCSPKPCKDCLGIVKKYCELYHQLKCLELQLSWQVDKLWNVMRWADRVPSRLKSFRSTDNFKRKLEFRKALKRKCKRHFSDQLPRVSLSKSLPVCELPKTEIAANTVIRDEQGVASSEVEFTGISIGTPTNFWNDKHQEKNTEYILLGWISSLAALIFLYHLDMPKAKSFQENATEESLEITIEEPESSPSPQVIPGSQSLPSSENDCDGDDVSSNACFNESQQSPYNCSTNDNDFEEEPSACVIDGKTGVQEESSSDSEEGIIALNSAKPLFVLEGSPQLLSPDLTTECGRGLTSQYEVPVTVVEEHSFVDQEGSTAFQNEKELFAPPVPSQSHIATNIDIGDVKLAFPSTPSLQPFHSTNELSTLTVLPKPSSSFPHQKRASLEEVHEAPVFFGRRSLRTKYQCSKCNATFSDVNRFEHHALLCSQSSRIESDSDSVDQEDTAVVKVDVDMHPNQDIVHGSPTNEAASLSSGGQRRSVKRATRKVIHYDNQKYDNDYWRMNDDVDGAKYESESTSEHESSGDEINEQIDTTNQIRRPITKRVPPSCTKCDLAFRSRAALKMHQNYKHSKGYVQFDTIHVKNMQLTRNSLQLEGISLETCFQCTLDPDKCTRNYPLSNELEKHKKLHGQFTCPVCDLTMTDALDLIDHEVEHTDEQQMLKDATFKKGDVYHCARCQYKAAITQEIVNHYLSEHLGLPGIEAQCPICQQRFPCHDTVPVTHYVNFHDLNRLDDRGDRVICNEAHCSAYFLREDQLHAHWTMEHTNIEIKIAKAKKGKQQKIWLNKQKLEKPDASTCPHCHRTFLHGCSLKLHISKLHVTKTWTSLGAMVISKDGLTVDDWVFEKGAKFFCKKNGCKDKFREDDAFQTHSKLHGEFPCNFCEVVKTFAGDLAIHEMVHVDKLAQVKTISNPGRMRFRCSRCPFRSGRKGRHVEHFVWKHLGGLLVDKKKCHLCQHGFKTSYEYKNSSRMIQNLKAQMYSHFVEWHDFTGIEGGEEGAFKCVKCLAYFRTNFQLMQHTDEVHDSPGPNKEEIGGLLCQDCGLVFSTVKALRSHRVGVHKIELKFACDVAECGEKFETARLLINHHNFNHSHSGDTNQERTFVCQQCDKKFFAKNGLRAHLRCHEPKKARPARPHVCEQCGKSFTEKVRLETHYKFHKGPETWDFACEICGKKIYSQQKLTEHMRVHTKEKPFVCQVCGVAYGHRHNLRIHVNSKHKEIQDLPRKCDTTNLGSSRKGKKIK